MSPPILGTFLATSIDANGLFILNVKSVCQLFVSDGFFLLFSSKTMFLNPSTFGYNLCGSSSSPNSFANCKCFSIDIFDFLINITKLSQNFFEYKVFHVLPDITKMTKKEHQRYLKQQKILKQKEKERIKRLQKNDHLIGRHFEKINKLMLR